MSSDAYDVVIVGAGIIGATIAYELCSQGKRVALLDAAKAGTGTSSATFAWINATAKSSEKAYHDLNASGMRGYRELVKVWGEDTIGYHPCGMLEWSDTTQAGSASALAQRVERLKSWDYPITPVTKSDLEALEPHIALPDRCEGLYAYGDAWLDVPTFIAFLTGYIRKSGGEVIENCGDVSLNMDENGEVITGLTAGTQSLTTSLVVLASGPDTPKALSMLTGHDFEARFPMSRSVGLLVDTPSTLPKRLVNHVLYLPDIANFHVRPNPDGGLLLGADDTDGMITEESSDDEIRKAGCILLDRAHDLFPDFPGASLINQCRFRVGIRALPADGNSVVGPILGVDGLVLAMTHSGITLAPGLAKLVAAYINTGVLPEELAPFSFDRFDAEG